MSPAAPNCRLALNSFHASAVPDLSGRWWCRRYQVAPRFYRASKISGSWIAARYPGHMVLAAAHGFQGFVEDAFGPARQHCSLRRRPRSPSPLHLTQ
eukprot:3637558-Rhodomonas_salina.1